MLQYGRPLRARMPQPIIPEICAARRVVGPEPLHAVGDSVISRSSIDRRGLGLL
jgi:hypothetical protein